MFIGHFGVGFAAKRATPRVNLGVLFAAAQLPDILWPIFLLAGWERARIAPGDTPFSGLAFEHYPWTHSLLAVLVWALLAGLAYRAWRRDGRGAVVVGLLVVSHWVLDAVTHRPDLPLYPGGPVVGLGLWNSIVGTMVVESAIYLGGLALYLSATRARDAIGRWGLWTLVALLALLYVADRFSGAPPSMRAVAWVSLAGAALFAFLAAWVDAHRDAAAGDPIPASAR